LGVTSLGRGGLGYLALSGILSLSDVWTSRDGQAWCLLSESSNGGFTDMVTVGATLVAVGASSSGPPLAQSAWFSADARDWEEVSAGPGGAGWSIGLVPGQASVVALGTSMDMDSPSSWMAWLTVDGRHWSRGVALPESNFRIEEAMSWEKGFVAVGGFYKGNDFGDGAVWRSTDGLHWAREQSTPVLPWLSYLVSGGDGLLAVGANASAPTAACGHEVWTSADAVHWRHVTSFCGDGPVYGLDGNGQHLVAVGLDGESAAVWASP
jgi:hypothetical protein